MKESEAQAKCQEIELGRLEVFCPLCNGRCQTNCESYVKTRVYNRSQFNDVDLYTWEGGYCDARMLHNREYR